MDLVNKTPLPAKLVVSEVTGLPHRIGLLTAKATFRMSAAAPLETEQPEPLRDADVETSLGFLPRDDIARQDGLLDVILLGAAYAKGGRPTRERRVALEVGSVRRELLVSGDRVWESRLGVKRISEAAPFARMPITWSRAFGGTASILVDRDAEIDVAHPLNAAGRGFDPAPAAAGWAEALKCPPGYPRFDPDRRLPNIEDPRAPITRPEDTPPPAGWSTFPLDSGMQAARATAVRDGEVEITHALRHRAHPDWVIRPPAASAQVTLEGLTEGERLTFPLPSIQVVADFLVGERVSTRALAAETLVLLPEEGRFYVVFQHAFSLVHHAGEDRCARVRLVDAKVAARAPARGLEVT